MYIPETVVENKTHKNIRDFEIQTDHPIPEWNPYPVLKDEEERKNKKIVPQKNKKASWLQTRQKKKSE